MSVVTVQVGQCGNQTGGSFFDVLASDLIRPGEGGARASREYCQQSRNRFFRQRPRRGLSSAADEPEHVARAVLVDMEQKAVAATRTSALRGGHYVYDAHREYVARRGSGNNWAYGYRGHGATACDDIVEMVRQEVELCDGLDGFLVPMSLAGGTGSGVGTALTEALRDRFPSAFLFNQVVWPYSTGEVIVQHYNAALTLAHLHAASDGILIFENDALQATCTRLLGLKDVSFDAINGLIAQSMACVFQPVSPSCAAPAPLGALCDAVCTHPSFPLLTVATAPIMPDSSRPFTTYRWPAVLRPVSTALRDRAVASLVVLRGPDAPSQARQLYSNSHTTVWHSERPFHRHELSAAVVTNSQSVVRPLEHTMTRASAMLAARAFLHQYERHGVSSDDFVIAFARVEQLIRNYQTL